MAVSIPLLSPSTYLWFLVGQLYLDFWVDHPVWFGDYSDAVLDNLYHHYVQTKDYGHWIFKESMQVAMVVQLFYLAFCCLRPSRPSNGSFARDPATADWLSLTCNALIAATFLNMIIPNRDAMSIIGKEYQTDEKRRLQFITHAKRLVRSHWVVLFLCLAGIVADYYASNHHAASRADAVKDQ